MKRTEPLTVVATWNIKPEKTAEFETWHKKLSAEATRFPGHLGVSVLRPSETQFMVIFRFDTYEHLLAWQNSNERNRMFAEAGAFQADDIRYETGHGTEFWFTPKGIPAPSLWKMTLLTALGLYPTLLLINFLLGFVERFMPAGVLEFVSMFLSVLALTYVVMPLITKIFFAWIYPDSRCETPSPQESDANAELS